MNSFILLAMLAAYVHGSDFAINWRVDCRIQKWCLYPLRWYLTGTIIK